MATAQCIKSKPNAIVAECILGGALRNAQRKQFWLPQLTHASDLHPICSRNWCVIGTSTRTPEGLLLNLANSLRDTAQRDSQGDQGILWSRLLLEDYRREDEYD
jgi:hypothetical protein